MAAGQSFGVRIFQHKPGTAQHAALCIAVTLMPVLNALHNGQPQTRATTFAGTVCIRTEKWRKHFLQVFLTDARPIVMHAQPYFLPVNFSINNNSTVSKPKGIRNFFEEM